MRKTAYILAVVVLLCAAPVFAQGPFNDVPTDHWAYDAVNTLQKDGIVIGYPDGTFGGKRAMSRYEFAVAIARLMPMIPGQPGAGVSNAELQKILQDYAKKSDLPDISKLATKADVDALRNLINEFRDELAALGVDVDALKRDVCALGARVDALEAEVKRVRFTGDVNVFAYVTDDRGSQVVPVDADNRFLSDAAGRDTIGRTLGVVKDFDLNVVGRVSDVTTANATINYGNYLNYLAFVDDYVTAQRPTSSGVGGFSPNSLSDNFFPYYLYINTALGKGQMNIGRFPIQFTPYTLKKIDVDSYTSILKTDSGNYPMDGAMLATRFGGVDVTLFAAKNNTNDYLVNGLTGQPNAGLFGTAQVKPGFNFFAGAGAPAGFVPGRAVGGLQDQVAQTAGTRIQFGTPWKGNIGATYYQAWSDDAFFGAPVFDQARVFGGDITIPFGMFGFAGSWTRSDLLAQDGIAGIADIDSDNTAWDAKLNFALGKLGVGAGYKNIERRFAAAGAWDKIGRWTNPTNVKGPYADFSYPIGRKLSIIANGEWLTMIDTVNPVAGVFGKADDTILKAEGGIKWGISAANSVDLGVEYVKWSPDAAGLDDAIETYYTVGWAHQISASTGFKIGYQFVNYNDGATGSGPYGAAAGLGNDYRGGIGVVQFGVNF